MKGIAQCVLIFFATYGLQSCIDDINTIIERRRIKKRWREFEAKTQARLDAMCAVKRDPYDGRPL